MHRLKCLTANNKIATFSNQLLGECLNKDYEDIGGIGSVKIKSWFGWVGDYINIELFDETTVHCPIYKQINDQSLRDTFPCAQCSSYSKLQISLTFVLLLPYFQQKSKGLLSKLQMLPGQTLLMPTFSGFVPKLNQKYAAL